ncbi:MAG: hypothetical protein KAU14_06120, partial [Thermoplasmata archaeon]|nr:hypothetical protein [Thermoplasmata archaeon]
YVGGGDYDYGYGIALDSQGCAVGTGFTRSSDFPTTPGCYDDSHNGNNDVFVFKLNADGSGLEYSTFVGGQGSDYGSGIALDSEGCAVVTGLTWSSDFPTTAGCFDDSRNGNSDVFVFKLNFIRPTAHIDSITPSPSVKNENTTLKGHGTDDGSIVRYVWNSSIDGEIHNGTEANFTCSNLSLGQHNITLRVQDNDGYWSDEALETLIITLKPTAFIDTISPNPALDIEDIHFSGHGNDSDGTIQGYQWNSSIDGVFGTEADFFCSNLSNGTHSISLRVQDNYGVWSNWTEWGEPLVITAKPMAIIDSITPNPAIEGEAIHFQGHGTDDGSITHYIWTSSIEGELHKGTESSFTTPDLSLGNHTISFRVQDDLGFWSLPATSRLIVTLKPIASIESISPNPAPPGTSVVFSGNGTDNGLIVRYVWKSSIDGPLYSGPNSTFTNSSLSVGLHTIYLKVQDDSGVWSEEVNTTLKAAIFSDFNPSLNPTP